VRKNSFPCLASALVVVALAAASPACSSSSEPTLTTGARDGGSSGAADARAPYPSFRADVLPIVQESCALTACHSSKESNLGIFLGYDAAQVYAELKKTSPTAAGEKFVVPGDPVKSYLVVKLEGKQGALTSKCASNNCGVVMPPDEPLSAEKIETFRKWIADGAKDD
jgi:hypothetical protein